MKRLTYRAPRAGSQRRCWYVLLLTFLLASAAPIILGDELTVTIPIPRHGPVRVGLITGPMDIRAVHLENQPDRGDIRSGSVHPEEAKEIRWVFRVVNTGGRAWKARIELSVFDKGGHQIGNGEAEVDSRNLREAVILRTPMRVMDFEAADHAVIEARFRQD